MKHKTVIYQLRFERFTYIGRTSNFWQRINTHLVKMRHGNHTKRVQMAYDKYGEPKVGIIHHVTDDEYAPEVEANCIAGAGAFSLNQHHANKYAIDIESQEIKNRFIPDLIHEFERI